MGEKQTRFEEKFRLEKERRENGRYYWQMVAKNNHPVCFGKPEGYGSPHGLKAAIDATANAFTFVETCENFTDHTKRGGK